MGTIQYSRTRKATVAVYQIHTFAETRSFRRAASFIDLSTFFCSMCSVRMFLLISFYSFRISLRHFCTNSFGSLGRKKDGNQDMTWVFCETRLGIGIRYTHTHTHTHTNKIIIMVTLLVYTWFWWNIRHLIINGLHMNWSVINRDTIILATIPGEPSKRMSDPVLIIPLWVILSRMSTP